MTALVSPKFTIDCMMCLHSSSLIVMSNEGYIMVWGIVEFKTFNYSFC